MDMRAETTEHRAVSHFVPARGHASTPRIMDRNVVEKLVEHLEIALKELDQRPLLVQDTPDDRNPDSDYSAATDGGKLYPSADQVELRPVTLKQRIGMLRDYLDRLTAVVSEHQREKEEVAGMLETVKKELANLPATGVKRTEPEPAANGTPAAADALDPKKAKPAAPVVVAAPKK